MHIKDLKFEIKLRCKENVYFIGFRSVFILFNILMLYMRQTEKKTLAVNTLLIKLKLNGMND